MTTSDQTIYAALAAFQAEASNVPKDARNTHFRNRYATLASVTAGVQPAARYGLSHSQTFEVGENVNVVMLITTIYHVSGSSIKSVLPLTLTGDWQKNGSAITYARRYSLLAAFGLAPDDDDDGNSAAAADRGAGDQSSTAHTVAPRPAPARQPNGAPRPQAPPVQRSGNGNSAPPAAVQPQLTQLVTSARSRLLAAGITKDGSSVMFAELGAQTLLELPAPVLERLATAGPTAEEISRWNGPRVTATAA